VDEGLTGIPAGIKPETGQLQAYFSKGYLNSKIAGSTKNSSVLRLGGVHPEVVA